MWKPRVYLIDLRECTFDNSEGDMQVAGGVVYGIWRESHSNTPWNLQSDTSALPSIYKSASISLLPPDTSAVDNPYLENYSEKPNEITVVVYEGDEVVITNNHSAAKSNVTFTPPLSSYTGNGGTFAETAGNRFSSGPGQCFTISTNTHLLENPQYNFGSAAYLQVDLESVYTIESFLTSGINDQNHAVTKFLIYHSVDGHNWVKYYESFSQDINHNPQCPSDLTACSSKQHNLSPHITMRFIRVYPSNVIGEGRFFIGSFKVASLQPTNFIYMLQEVDQTPQSNIYTCRNDQSAKDTADDINGCLSCEINLTETTVAAGCEALCNADSECAAFEYSKSVCHLYNFAPPSDHDIRPAPGAVLCTRQSNLAGTRTFRGKSVRVVGDLTAGGVQVDLSGISFVSNSAFGNDTSPDSCTDGPEFIRGCYEFGAAVSLPDTPTFKECNQTTTNHFFDPDRRRFH